MKTFFILISLIYLCLNINKAIANNEWHNLGIEGGAVNNVAISPDGKSIFAATSGGLYRSDDQCNNWYPIDNTAPTNQLIRSSLNGTLYTVQKTTDELKKTIDNGLNWTTIPLPENYKPFSVHPDLHNDKILYLIAFIDNLQHAALFRSDNDGDNWTLQYDFGASQQTIHQLVLAGSKETLIYAIVSSIYLNDRYLVSSGNNGITWDLVAENYIESIIVSTTNYDNIYITQGSGEAPFLFMSVDAGLSWVNITDINITRIAGIHDDRLFGPAKPTIDGIPLGYIQTTPDGSEFERIDTPISQMQNIVFDPTNGQIGYSGSNYFGMLKTINGGASWTRCNNGLTAGYLTSISHHPYKFGALVAFGGNSSAFSTTNSGKNWTRTSLNGHSPFGKIRHAPSQPNIVYANVEKKFSNSVSGNFLHISQNSGINFIHLENNPIQKIPPSISPLEANTILIGVRSSSDGGKNWNVPSQLPIEPIPFNVYSSYDNLNPNLIVGVSTNTIYRSQDGGNIWTNETTIPIYTITPPVASPTQTGTFYLKDDLDRGLYKTIDGGKHWNQITNRATHLIAVDPKRSNTLYAMFMDGIYLSQDGGNSFTFVTEPPLGAAPATQEFLVDPTNSQRLIAATLGGLYAYEQTTDDCTTHVKYDQNCDGKADIVWRNATSGQNWYHAMDGHLVTTSSPINTVNQPWRIIGRGDFDGDGKSDLLWRNDESGLNYLYLMDGNTILSGKPVNQVPVDSGWDIISVADYNGDGKDDMLWRNANDGLIWQYQMDGANIIKSQRVTTLSDPQWQLVASPDLNGDGKADLLWRHQGNGLVWKYLMDGHLISSNGKIMQASLDWQLVIAGDFDGDHDADLLWRNTTDGRNYVYLLDQGVVNWSNRGLISQFSDQNWHAVMAGDFDGDGDDDIFWRHAGDGRNYMYLMDGKNYQGKTVGRIADLNWQPVQ